MCFSFLLLTTLCHKFQTLFLFSFPLNANKNLQNLLKVALKVKYFFN